MMFIRNYYEQLVVDQLWELQENSKVPLTLSFLEDVACLALNSLPTCYVRNLVDKGANLTEMEHHELRQKTIEAITKAINTVRNHPHDKRDE